LSTIAPLYRTPYHGVIIPMITPIFPSGELDEPAVRRVIDHLIEGGVSGIFILGTTGESASASAALKSRLVALTVEHTGKRVLVYAGISHNCLTSSVEAAQAFFELGVDVTVAHLPSYYELNPAEQEAYYITLSKNITGPLMLYNIPSTTHMSMPLEVIARLSNQPNIVGIKDSENNASRLANEIKLLGGRPDFSIMIGANALFAQMLRLGADGIVPSLGNLVPRLFQRLYDYSRAGDAHAAKRCQQLINELSHLLRSGLSLGQALAAHKAAMCALSLCGPAMLPPLQALMESQQQKLHQTFTAYLAKL
jgi:dihydrodipicolinate synthase/N-acetylneuraminate lyase